MDYELLKVDFEIPNLIQNDINRFLDALNNGNTSCEDCYRTEIDCDLKMFYDEMKRENIETLRDYYVRGGMYEEFGDPRPWKI